MRVDRFTAAVFLQLAIVCSSIATQPRAVAQGRVDFSVTTVRLGSSDSRVTAHLGRPASDTTHRDDSLGSVEIVRTLKYPGLVVTLHKTRRVFRVVSIDVTSTDWLVAPGLRVGLDAKQVIARSALLMKNRTKVLVTAIIT
jgi:hypothetical protein